MRSLRKRLLAWLLLPLVLVGVAAGLGAYAFLERRLTVAYDLDLSDIARAIVPYVRMKNGVLTLTLSPDAERVLRADSTDQIGYAVLDDKGRVVAGDATLPRAPMPPRPHPQFWDDFHQGRGIRAVTIAGVNDGIPVQVVATETRRKREQASRDAALSAIVPTTLLSVAAVLAVLVGVGRGLGPVDDLRRQLQARSYRDLRPVEEGAVANELRPLVHELNEMLARVEGAQSLQARFIADAAHQLRTPIAGLITQLDLARSDVRDDSHLRQAREGAARLGRLAQQILSLATADPLSNPEVPLEPSDLADIVKDQGGTWLRSVTPRGVELEFDLAPAPIKGNHVLLGELASNLVDNAARYGATLVKVRCGMIERGARDEIGVRYELSRSDSATDNSYLTPISFLEVSDDGPGIPPAERARIFERFRRLDNESTEGSGLGLSIVKEIAQRHGAVIEVTEGEDGKGTRIVVVFGGGAAAR
jgi:two-component system, OmpR family, sensor histidine kinase TctE